jgi:hypothetical protein
MEELVERVDRGFAASGEGFGEGYRLTCAGGVRP